MTPAQFWDIEMQNQRNNTRMAMEANLANTQQQQQMVSDIGSAIVGMASGYAENKALDAKGKAYGEFLSMHGEQLGFAPEYLEDFLKKKPREQAMIGDNIIGMQNTGNRLMSLNYMNEQANLFGGNRGTGAGGGGGGGNQVYVPFGQ